MHTQKRILIVTQKMDINDPILGFFHRWVEEFSRRAAMVTVICLQEGEHHLPENVRVLSLGKEQRRSRWQYVCRFYRYIWSERTNYDTVFVHMNPIYVVLGGALWIVWGKRVGLWYAHSSVTPALRAAIPFAHHIFTSTAYGCRVGASKQRIIGQGVDTEVFSCPYRTCHDRSPLTIVSVSRISPVKELEVLIRAVAIARERGVRCSVTLIGSPNSDSDIVYMKRLIKLVEDSGLQEVVTFTGAVRNTELTSYLCKATVFACMGDYGGLDKAFVEAMACGLLPWTANTPARSLFHIPDRYCFVARSPESAAHALENISRLTANQRRMDSERFVQIARMQNIGNLAKSVLSYLYENKSDAST